MTARPPCPVRQPLGYAVWRTLDRDAAHVVALARAIRRPGQGAGRATGLVNARTFLARQCGRAERILSTRYGIA